jgi:hypothetical protein
MAFNIDQFRSKLNFDGARPNLFEVVMNFPTLAGVISGSQSVQDEFRFMCRAAQLPGSTIGPVIVPYFGREVKLAGNRVFPDWTVTIINDEDFKIRNAFEQWMNGINQHVDNRRSLAFRSTTSYSTNATIWQYTKSGGLAKSYTFTGMFPIDISPIDVDWGSNDTIEEYTVTFQYQYWIASTTSTIAGITSVPPGEPPQ